MDYKKQLYYLIGKKKYHEATDIIINHLEIQETVEVFLRFKKERSIRNYTFPLIYFIKQKLPEYYNIIALLLSEEHYNILQSIENDYPNLDEIISSLYINLYDICKDYESPKSIESEQSDDSTESEEKVEEIIEIKSDKNLIDNNTNIKLDNNTNIEPVKKEKKILSSVSKSENTNKKNKDEIIYIQDENNTRIKKRLYAKDIFKNLKNKS